MNNQDSLRFFESLSNKPVTLETTKFQSSNDHSQIDADFVRQYITDDSDVLDLAAGTGIMLNKYYTYANSVVAVEKFEQFAKLIVNDPKVRIVIADIAEYETTEKYDVIVLFATAHYFNEAEIVKLYKKYIKNLKPNGKLIVKNQFGVNETVNVSGYSEELKNNYYAQYRYLQLEIELLKSAGFNHVEHYDIYPAAFNRWSNTHFYAIVASVE